MHVILVLKSLQSSEAVVRKSTKRIADESNDVTKKNVSFTGVPSSASQKSVDNAKPTDRLPASLRNIHQLSSALDNEMTNGGRFVKHVDVWFISF